MAFTFLLSLGVWTTSCNRLPKPPRTDPDGTALNASRSLWLGVYSNGSTSRVRQVSTGPNQYRFTETWYVGGKIINTEGSGKYEPKTQTNIYAYSQTEGVVVVKTTEEVADRKTTGFVLNSTVDLFKAGETITYTKRPKPLE